MRNRKILIMGLPGAGKTTLAKALAPMLGAVLFNADDVRLNISKDLGFSPEDRIEHARRMGWLCDRVVEAGGTAIADFVCPTVETRKAFGDAFLIFVDRIEAGRFADTNQMFEPPGSDLRVKNGGSPLYWASEALGILRPTFDPKNNTALFVGRYQPFHDGHKKLIENGIWRVGQACIAVRDTHGLHTKNQVSVSGLNNNPLSFHAIKQRIETALAKHAGKFCVVQVPNISHIFYGRDVGYVVERIGLDEETESISGTKIRKSMNA